jgi:hypothetical protein
MATSAVRNLETASEAGAAVEAVTEEPSIETLNIHQRLFGIMSELKPLEKDKEVKNANGRVMYEYISHDAVTAHIRPLLIKYRVMVQPTVDSVKTDGNRTELEVAVHFINVDNPADAISVGTIGYGVDPSDKGPGKAFSYALKYAYLKLFLLNSGDDIEEQDLPHDSAVMTANQKEDSERRVVEDMQAWAHTFKAALENAKSVKEIDTLQRANKDKLMSSPEVTRDFFVGLIEQCKSPFETTPPDGG